MPEFKLARYANWGYPSGCGPKYGQVLYVVVGKRCIFSGLIDNATSTINACEAIVEEIARLEKCGIDGLVFYDLQTHVAYSSKHPGVFEIDRIVVHHHPIEDEINDMLREAQGDIILKVRPQSWTPCWNPANLSQKIIEMFRPCIGHLGQIRTNNEALKEIIKAYKLHP